MRVPAHIFANAVVDALAIEIAGHYLQTALESGEGMDREMYSLTINQTLKHLDAVVNTPQPVPAGVADSEPRVIDGFRGQ